MEKAGGVLPLSGFFLREPMQSEGQLDRTKKSGYRHARLASKMNCVKRCSAALISSPDGRICEGGNKKPVPMAPMSAFAFELKTGTVRCQGRTKDARVAKFGPERPPDLGTRVCAQRLLRSAYTARNNVSGRRTAAQHSQAQSRLSPGLVKLTSHTLPVSNTRPCTSRSAFAA